MLGRLREHGNTFRQRRFAKFLSLVDSLDICGRVIRILDLGGAMEYWEALQPLWNGRSFHVTIINLDRPNEEHPPHYSLRTGDACDLRNYEDNAFDIVHSNSVIEHVGGWSQMRAMAKQTRRLAPHYFVQTPNLWFPLEAHYRLPLVQFLPEAIRARMLVKKQRGYMPRCPDLDHAMIAVQSTNLLEYKLLQALFPDASIHREKILGLTKSITAMR